MVAVTDKHDNKHSQVDPTEGIHKLFFFQGSNVARDGIEPPTRGKENYFWQLRPLVTSCKLSFPPVKPGTVLMMSAIQTVEKEAPDPAPQ